MAIGHAAYAAGDREGAAAVLQRFFARPKTPREDPWWDYPFGNWRDADPALNALRAEARK
jgi:hypothetical protein